MRRKYSNTRDVSCMIMVRIFNVNPLSKAGQGSHEYSHSPNMPTPKKKLKYNPLSSSIARGQLHPNAHKIGVREKCKSARKLVAQGRGWEGLLIRDSR